jgi:putative DNA methylase
MTSDVTTRKKLIEVALPLEAINIASAKEKSIRHGHPSTLHLWWARRPLATARAVIFSQMVDDPSAYTEELLANDEIRSLAAEELERRYKRWVERKVTYEEAGQDTQTTVPAPGPEPTLDESVADLERERLFDIIRQLVTWENTTNETVLSAAREEIWKSWCRTCADNKRHPQAKDLFDPKKLPAFHDPFAGGGSIPVEAQRLGLETFASDLNPVAVLINKGMIEIPAKFAGRPPVNPESQSQKSQMGKMWQGALGLAEDVRFYGNWMREEAERRIGHLYPKVEVTAEMAKTRPDLKPYVGRKLRVIAWLWARTVKSPNPAFAEVDIPLASNFMLSTKIGKEAYVEPVIEGKSYRFDVKIGRPKNIEAAKHGTKLSRGANFRCLMSDTAIPSDHIYAEANAGRMGTRLMAVVAEGDRARLYLPPTPEMEETPRSALPTWMPELEMPKNPRWFSPPLYGLKTYGDLFTSRQLVALETYSGLLQEALTQIRRDASDAEDPLDSRHLRDGGTGATSYAEAVALYLAFAFDKLSTTTNTICTWQTDPTRLVAAFGRQAIQMTWDFAEANAFGDAAGDFHFPVLSVTEVLPNLPATGLGFGYQQDASAEAGRKLVVVSTDPPYYDNIGYADLSEFFYVWLRRSLKLIFPDLFATLAVPKAQELVATPSRHGGKEKAEAFFLNGMTEAMRRLAENSYPSFPVTIYYAFKQTENESNAGIASTGWETFLDAVIRAGLGVSGTWPVRTELTVALKKTIGALASSIVLVCHKRALDAAIVSRREFIAALKEELPKAVARLQRANIAPVDLAQASIGPGMAIYTRYAKVVDSSGIPLSVRDALALINEILDEVLAEQEGDFDADTRWALAWFEQFGFEEGAYGIAETLSKAKNTSISGLEEAGILISKAGRVRLLKPSDMPTDWDPSRDTRLTIWEMVHHLIRILETSGESGTASLYRELGTKAETARELPYRLYAICERKKRAQEALSYNGLVQSWPEIARLAREGDKAPELRQVDLFGQER